MLIVKYLLSTIGFGLLLGAAGVLMYDLYWILRPLWPGASDLSRRVPLRWSTAGRLAAIGLVPLLFGASIMVLPSGQAGVRISQFSGTLPGTLYPGVHWSMPLVERVELFNTRDRVFSTSLTDDPKKKDE